MFFDELVQFCNRYGQMVIKHHLCYFVRSTQTVDVEWMKIVETPEIN